MASNMGNQGSGGRHNTRSHWNCPTNQYCWTYGACGHSRAICRAWAEGHQADATFQNKMNGSTKNVCGNWWCGTGLIDNYDKEHKNTSITDLSQIPLVPPTKHYKATLVVPSRSFASVVIPKADSGASRHYFCPNDAKVLHNLCSTNTGPIVHLSNNSTIQATQKGNLSLQNISTLSTAATETHVFPKLQSSSLISIGQLCDDNCMAILDKIRSMCTKTKTL